MAESEKELKSLLMKVKEESENTGKKLNIQKIIQVYNSVTLVKLISGTTATRI